MAWIYGWNGNEHSALVMGFMVLFWVGGFLLVVKLVAILIDDRATPISEEKSKDFHARKKSEAEMKKDEIKKWYAIGEINRQEYQEMLKDLKR